MGVGHDRHAASRLVIAAAFARLGGLAERRPVAALIVLMLALLAPGFATLPPIDRDEARFAQASKQMLETGDFVAIRFQDQARNKKPVGIYWMQAAAAAAAGGPAAAPIWAYRIPSAIGAILAVLFTYLAGRALLERRSALIGAALFGASALLVAEGHLAKTDAMQAAAIAAAMAGLARVWTRREEPGPAPWGDVLLIWLGLGASVLIKGPVGLMTAGLAVLALWALGGGIGWLRRTRPLPGVLIAAAAVAPWAILITQVTGGRFWTEAICVDLLPKIAGQLAVDACGQVSPDLAVPPERGAAPPGLYLLLAFATFFPASLLLVPAIWRMAASRKADWARFLIAWAVPTWIVFEALPLKLPHYVLPAYPALALAAGAFLGARLAGVPDTTPAWTRWLNAVLFLLVALALSYLMVFARLQYGGGADALDMALAAAVVALAGFAAWTALAERWAATTPALGALALATFASLFNVTLDRADDLHVSPRLAEAVAGSGGGPVASAGYHEASLVFLTATSTRLTDGDGAAGFLAERGDGVALVEEREKAAFEAGLAARRIEAREAARVEGFNYSNGRKVSIGVYRRVGP